MSPSSSECLARGHLVPSGGVSEIFRFVISLLFIHVVLSKDSAFVHIKMITAACVPYVGTDSYCTADRI